MPYIEEYYLINTEPGAIAENINHMIKDGWRVYGHLVPIIEKETGNTLLLQPMVKYGQFEDGDEPGGY